MGEANQNPFTVGDIVDMHCGEQGIVVEILDDFWVNLLQCNGHIAKAMTGDIWEADNKQNGKEALHEMFMKTFGYSGICEESQREDISEKPVFEDIHDKLPF